MRAMSVGLTSLSLMLGVTLLLLNAQEPPTPQTSVSDGVYTAQQAAHGRSLYNDTCAACHGADLGGAEMAPALKGAPFLSHWNGKALGALFDKIQNTMPEGNPGSLSRDSNADILAYILSTNGFPSGKSELSSKPDMLTKIRMEPSKPGVK